MKVKYRAEKKAKNLDKFIVIQTQTFQKMALLSRPSSCNLPTDD